MYPNRTHIYEFIKMEFGLNKKALAAKLFFGASNLAPSRHYDPERMYEFVFKVEAKEVKDKNTKAEADKEKKDSEDKIQNSLKYFMREFEGVLADIWNKNYEDFVMELLKRANVPPPVDTSMASVSAPQTQSEVSAGQVRDLFVEITEHYGIMEIVNRKPAILRREDSDKMNIYLGKIDGLIQNNPCSENDMLLYSSIENFSDTLRIQVFSIMAHLNNNFDFEDESAFIDMEEDETPIEPEETKTAHGVLKPTPELVSVAANPLRLMETIFKEWGNFRNELNLLYKEIKEGTDITG